MVIRQFVLRYSIHFFIIRYNFGSILALYCYRNSKKHRCWSSLHVVLTTVDVVPTCRAWWWSQESFVFQLLFCVLRTFPLTFRLLIVENFYWMYPVSRHKPLKVVKKGNNFYSSYLHPRISQTNGSRCYRPPPFVVVVFCEILVMIFLKQGCDEISNY